MNATTIITPVMVTRRSVSVNWFVDIWDPPAELPATGMLAR